MRLRTLAGWSSRCVGLRSRADRRSAPGSSSARPGRKTLIATLTRSSPQPPCAAAARATGQRSTPDGRVPPGRLHRPTFSNDKEALVYTTGSRTAAATSAAPAIGCSRRRASPDGSIVMVNRGFVPQDRQDPTTRRGGQPHGEVDIVGVLRWPEQRGLFTPADEPAAQSLVRARSRRHRRSEGPGRRSRRSISTRKRRRRPAACRRAASSRSTCRTTICNMRSPGTGLLGLVGAWLIWRWRDSPFRSWVARPGGASTVQASGPTLPSSKDWAPRRCDNRRRSFYQCVRRAGRAEIRNQLDGSVCRRCRVDVRALRLDPGRGARARLRRRHARRASPATAASMCRETWPRSIAASIAGFAGRPYAEVALRGDRARSSAARSRTPTSRAWRARPMPPSAIRPSRRWSQLGAEHVRARAVPRPDARLQGRGDAAPRPADGPRAGERGERATIVGATSGDTGGAAVEAFRGRAQVDVVVLLSARPHLRGAAAHDDDRAPTPTSTRSRSRARSTIARRS